MTKVGVVGCGLMGFGIATNLIKKGYEVSVYDVQKEPVEKLVHLGAKSFDNIQPLAKEVDVLILSLPSADIIEKVLTDESEGALSVMKKGSAILDMSTNDVAITRNLFEQAKQYEVDFFDCPLSGGPTGATDGTLTIMVGGDEDKFQTILPILQAVGKNIDYVGASGAGQIVKLCNNMLVGGIISLISEALMTGEAAGVAKEKVAEILQKGSGHTKVMDVFGPHMLENSFDNVTFSLANMTKDLTLYRQLVESVAVPAFASQSTHQLYKVASYQEQHQKDCTIVYELLDQLRKEHLKSI